MATTMFAVALSSPPVWTELVNGASHSSFGVQIESMQPLAGRFSGRARPDSFEVRLVRADTGADLVPWTRLKATVDNVAGTFAAELPNVPAGAGFTREIRWRQRPEIILRDGDLHAVGLVLVDIGQSQLAYQGYAFAANDVGSGNTLVPYRDSNTWIAKLGQPFKDGSVQQSFGAWYSGVGLFSPYKADQTGDRNIFTYEAIRRTLGVPVMIVDTAIPGSHPQRFYLDRKQHTISGFTTASGGFVPNGTKTIWTSLTMSSPELLTRGNATAANENVQVAVKPGTLALNFSNGVTVTDDGNKNLVGTGITAGTIDYLTGIISNLTFAAAPATGVTCTGSYTFFSRAPESGVLKPETGMWSAFGDVSLGLNRANNTGRTLSHLRRLRGCGISMFRVFWFTAFDGVNDADHAAIFDDLKAAFDAAYPAGASALWGFALPGRSVASSGSELAGTYRFMPAQQCRSARRCRCRGFPCPRPAPVHQFRPSPRWIAPCPCLGRITRPAASAGYWPPPASPPGPASRPASPPPAALPVASRHPPCRPPPGQRPSFC